VLIGIGARAARGFSLVELLFSVALAGILSSLAYPSYQAIVLKARRNDGRAAVAQAQLAEERYRSDHPRYGSLPEIGAAPVSAAGHYTVGLAAASESGFELRLAAAGTQVADADCRYMKLVVNGLDSVYASGADERHANAAAANKTCWGL
jgi:type IV pilus assembly protein PilE